MSWSIAILTVVVIFFGWAIWLELRAIRRILESLRRSDARPISVEIVA